MRVTTEVTTEVTAEAVAIEMRDSGEWAIDVLANLAERDAKSIREIAEGNTGSEWHSAVPAFLRKLADAVEASSFGE